MNFGETNIDKLSNRVTDETYKYCRRIMERYDDLDIESKKIARQSFYSAILNDSLVKKRVENSMNEQMKRLLD